MNKPILLKPYKELDNGALDQCMEDRMDDLADKYSSHPEVVYTTQMVKDILAIKAARASNQEVMNRVD